MPINPDLLQLLEGTTIPDEQKHGIRMEAIFMPDARSRRDKLYLVDPQRQPRFVHYTSADAAISIINRKRVWMRSTTSMVDYREVQHGYEMLAAFFQTPEKLALQVAVDSLFEGAFEEAVKAFDAWWNDTRFGTYIASLSEHDEKEDINGRLSMWRAFGSGSVGPKVAIVLRPPTFSRGLNALKLWFSPVSYIYPGEGVKVFDEVRANVVEQAEYLRGRGREAIVNQLFSMLLGAVTCIKHEGFEEEREWRAIYAPQRDASSLMEHSIKVVGGVPQTVWQLPLDSRVSEELADIDLATMFDRIIIGPSQFHAAIGEAFRHELQAIGVPDAQKKIFASLIPLRS